MDILVTYDIRTDHPAGERRLAKVAAVCERYGQRAQKSVFECRLDALLLQQLKGELGAEIDRRSDSVNLYQMAQGFETARQSIGLRGLDWAQAWVL
jgi:CRISPR-associated protein Cas2